MKQITLHEMRTLAESGDLIGNASPVRVGGDWRWRARTRRGEWVECPCEHCGPCGSQTMGGDHDAVAG